METKVIMPKLGLTMKEGTIEKWLKEEGSNVTKGEPLFEVATDKLTNEVEAKQSGILKSILVKAGETVPCQEVLAIILSTDE